MEKKQKSHISPIVYVMISVFLIIGYAYLTSNLTINGASLLKKATWDVHFENVQVKDGSVTGEQVTQEPEIDSEQTTVSFHVNLKKPGDFYEFTVDAVNAGTIDAMINTYTEFNLTEDQLKYLETSVTYEDGEEIAEKQQLLAGDFAVYKIVVSFKKDLEADDLPSSPEQLDLTYTVEYVQKDDTAIRRRAENTPYNILKEEANSGNGFVLKYTGEHQDSMDASQSNKDIYYWHADNDEDASVALNKNNVLFANRCWKMIRTTDTGGIRLLYNGEAVDNTCLNDRPNHAGYYGVDQLSLWYSNYYYGSSFEYDPINKKFSLSGDIERVYWGEETGKRLIGKYTCASTSESGSCSTIYLLLKYMDRQYAKVVPINSNSHYSILGSSSFNGDLKNLSWNAKSSPTYIGYMSNDDYLSKSFEITPMEKMLSSASLNTSYWYFDDIVWGTPVEGRYNSVNAFQVDSNNYNSLSTKYTFRSSSNSAASTKAYYIAGISDSTYYYIELDSGNYLDYYNNTYTYGDSYTINNDGSYTIDNPTTIERVDWFSNYSKMKRKYVCKNAINNTCDDLWYTYSTSLYDFTYESLSNDYRYAKGFNYIYDENTDSYKYVLSDGLINFWKITDSSNRIKLNNAHYTCFNSSGECESLYYIFYLTEINYKTYIAYCIALNNGDSITDAMNKLFYDNANRDDSIIKTIIEAWYKDRLLKYDNYLEDTIYCNDRSTKNFSSSGWNPNGGKISEQLEFISSSDLKCRNLTDSFSIYNSAARLNYKVGLITYNELVLLNKMSNDGYQFWTGSPGHMSLNSSFPWTAYTKGSFGLNFSATSGNGIKPAISIKPGIAFESGNGSVDNPYYIKTEFDD